MPNEFAVLHNGQAIPIADCPVVSLERFRELVVSSVADDSRLSALLCEPTPTGNQWLMTAVLSRPDSCDLHLIRCFVGPRYASLTPDCLSAHWFEREIHEQTGIVPEGHPWLKPIRFQHSHLTSNRDGKTGGTVGVTEFFQMQGEEVHEVAVGPVHAGVIEPGHFRFQCHGETVHHLEISLGYQHRGIERALSGGPDARTIHFMETLSGDTSIGHCTAYCGALEALSEVHPSARADAIRAIAAELERLANHVGDLGALAGDVGFLTTLSYYGRLRGDLLNLTAMLCGNRFGRGLVVPGGVAYDLDDATAQGMLRKLDDIEPNIKSAAELLFGAPSVLARFEGTGMITEELALELGLTGVAARACEVPCDVRSEFPYGLYRFTQLPECTWSTGDCFARAYVRWLEIEASLDFVRAHLQSLPAGQPVQQGRAIRPDHLVVSLTEGWRGEICHVAATDSMGRFAFYKVVDPSFHNWFGLAYALRGQQISDFPLCNKSFNLSYCGHDL